jgi:hypothetical protein
MMHTNRADRSGEQDPSESTPVLTPLESEILGVLAHEKTANEIRCAILRQRHPHIVEEGDLPAMER